jgi:apolipoprotein N-acyltransferase
VRPELVGRRAAIAAALASALLLWASSPAVGAGWLAWIALAPAAAVAIADPGRAGRLAVPLALGLYLELLFIGALPFGLADGQWGDPFLPVLIAGSPLPLVALILIPLFTVALFALDLGRPWPRRLPSGLQAAAVVLAPALALTALEVVRVKLEPGGAWGPLYLSQAGLPPGSLAGLGGPWLVTIAIVATGYGIGLAIARRRLMPALATAAAVIAGTVVASSIIDGSDDSADPLTVAAVQPGYDTAEEDRPQLRYWETGTHDLAALDVIADLAPLTREAADAGAELVVWPEATMFVDPRSEPEVQSQLLRLTESTGVTLFVPYFLRYSGLRSEALVVIPGPGAAPPRFTESRAKQRPLWFLGERSGGNAASEPLDAGVAELGFLPGLDGIDPALPAGLAGEGAELLVAPTHDWEALAVQQRAAERLAARDSGLPLVRADWRYGSVVYSANGEVLADAGTGLDREVLIATLTPGAGGTPYAKLGDALAWVVMAAGALLLLLSRLPSPVRRSRTVTSPTAPSAG